MLVYTIIVYLFILVTIKYYIIYFVAQIVSAFVIGSASRLVPVIFYAFHFLGGVGHFLIFWHHGMSQAHLVFPFPDLESIMFPRSPGSLFEEWYLETKLWVFGVCIAREVSLLPDPLSGQSYVTLNLY